MLIDDVLKYGSVSIAGLEKNSGKTETLNYILRESVGRGRTMGVTSIGVDGETTDALFGTQKPDIELFEGMVFATSEKHYLARKLTSEVLAVTDIMTALGRIVVGRVLSPGKVLLSGAADTAGIRKLIECMEVHGAETILVDGALNRLSLSAPVITDAMVLATGAAVSPKMTKAVERTAYTCKLIGLPVTSGDAERTEIAGALTDKMLREMMSMRIVVKDFTKVFVSEEMFARFERSGGVMEVVDKTNLIAVTINPTSPSGVVFDGELFMSAVKDAIDCQVYNVRN